MMEPIYAALERGERLNIYFELAGDFRGLDFGALASGCEGFRLHRIGAPLGSWNRDGACHGQGLGSVRRERVRLDGPR